MKELSPKSKVLAMTLLESMDSEGRVKSGSLGAKYEEVAKREGVSVSSNPKDVSKYAPLIARVQAQCLNHSNQ